MEKLKVVEGKRFLNRGQGGSKVLSRIRLLLLKLWLRIRYGWNTEILTQEEFVLRVSRRIQELYNQKYSISNAEDQPCVSQGASADVYPEASSYGKE
jgi:hypothetical protein